MTRVTHATRVTHVTRVTRATHATHASRVTHVSHENSGLHQLASSRLDFFEERFLALPLSRRFRDQSLAELAVCRA